MAGRGFLYFIDRIPCPVLEIPGIASQLPPSRDCLCICGHQDGALMLVKDSLSTPHQGCLCDVPRSPTCEIIHHANLLSHRFED
jgi:hypothetical protein